VDTTVLRPHDDGYEPTPRGRSGSGGTHTLQFQVIAEGQTSVLLLLRRPWDPADSAREKYGFVVKVGAT